MVKRKFVQEGVELRLAPSEFDRWRQNGWLQEDGVCTFPIEVKESLLEVRVVGLPPTWWDIATPSAVAKALRDGFIQFKNSQNQWLTKAQYARRYGEYPAPELLAQVLGVMLPQKNVFVRVIKA